MSKHRTTKQNTYPIVCIECGQYLGVDDNAVYSHTCRVTDANREAIASWLLQILQHLPKNTALKCIRKSERKREILGIGPLRSKKAKDAKLQLCTSKEWLYIVVRKPKN